MEEPPIKKTKSVETLNNMIKRKRQYLEVGHKGFLATCNLRDKLCVRDCYAILNKFATDMYGPEPGVKQKVVAGQDITDLLDIEIDAVHESMNPSRPRRFQAVYTGVKKSIFIRTTLPDPVALSKKIITDLAESKMQTTRFIERLIPVEIVCLATVKDITKAGKQLVEKYFSGEPKVFSIVSKRRCNKDIDRALIISTLAGLIIEKNPAHKVDLMKPELSLIAEVIRGKCCMSVVEKYKKYLRYNLIKLCEDNDNDELGEEENINEDAEDDNLAENDDLDTYQDYTGYELKDLRAAKDEEKSKNSDGSGTSSVNNGEKKTGLTGEKKKDDEQKNADKKTDSVPMDTDGQQKKTKVTDEKPKDGGEGKDSGNKKDNAKKTEEAKNTTTDGAKPPGEETGVRIEMPAHSKLKELLERPSVKKYKDPNPSPDKK